MAKLPKWMKIERWDKEDNQAIVIIRIRRWHPSWWGFYWSNVLRTAKEFAIPWYIWFPAALYRFFFSKEYFDGDDIHE